jgi:hypothetical protein
VKRSRKRGTKKSAKAPSRNRGTASKSSRRTARGGRRKR